MHYHYYKMSRDAAWQILRDSDICRMPVSVLKICRRIGVKVSYFDLEDDELGRIVMVNDTPHILLREDMSNETKRFVCAHELGHLLLNHFSEGTSYSFTVDQVRHGLENGAEQFAIRLLSPACVLWKCGITTVEEAAEFCGIEKELAAKRIRRMKQLYKRGKFLTSPLENEVYNKFLPFTEEYNRKKMLSE